MDVNNAFLQGDLHGEIYMTMPQGLPNPGNKVCLLKKMLYGLKQACRQWHAKVVDELHHSSFIQSMNDCSLFVKRQEGFFTIIGVYVYDILIIGNHTNEITHINQHLHDTFTIQDLGQLHYFARIEISYNSECIVLTQEKYTWCANLF